MVGCQREREREDVVTGERTGVMIVAVERRGEGQERGRGEDDHL